MRRDSVDGVHVTEEHNLMIAATVWRTISPHLERGVIATAAERKVEKEQERLRQWELARMKRNRALKRKKRKAEAAAKAAKVLGANANATASSERPW